eukprot:TRINITY_DN5681_c0_g1_i1.p1 TRINITY_DN5681_c0_g1~~TRINITY_DN5681_c0_g1_i1.p1  ORF type:complete len:263 (+),score=63.33 TRINITY_DN5681_c0_g1_i1:521-1309(+)
MNNNNNNNNIMIMLVLLVVASLASNTLQDTQQLDHDVLIIASEATDASGLEDEDVGEFNVLADPQREVQDSNNNKASGNPTRFSSLRAFFHYRRSVPSPYNRYSRSNRRSYNRRSTPIRATTLSKEEQLMVNIAKAWDACPNSAAVTKKCQQFVQLRDCPKTIENFKVIIASYKKCPNVPEVKKAYQMAKTSFAHCKYNCKNGLRILDTDEVQDDNDGLEDKMLEVTNASDFEDEMLRQQVVGDSDFDHGAMNWWCCFGGCN